jgi:hypothetical protein
VRMFWSCAQRSPLTEVMERADIPLKDEASHDCDWSERMMMGGMLLLMPISGLMGGLGDCPNEKRND